MASIEWSTPRGQLTLAAMAVERIEAFLDNAWNADDTSVREAYKQHALATRWRNHLVRKAVKRYGGWHEAAEKYGWAHSLHDYMAPADHTFLECQSSHEGYWYAPRGDVPDSSLPFVGFLANVHYEQ